MVIYFFQNLLQLDTQIFEKYLYNKNTHVLWIRLDILTAITSCLSVTKLNAYGI